MNIQSKINPNIDKYKNNENKIIRIDINNAQSLFPTFIWKYKNLQIRYLRNLSISLDIEWILFYLVAVVVVVAKCFKVVGCGFECFGIGERIVGLGDRL